MNFLRKSGKDGHPYAGAPVSGHIHLNDLWALHFSAGFDESWYGCELRKSQKNLLRRRLLAMGSIKFPYALPLDRDSTYEDSQAHWSQRHHLQMTAINYRGGTNSYKPKIFHESAIGLISRQAAFFAKEQILSTFYMSVLLSDDAFDFLEDKVMKNCNLEKLQQNSNNSCGVSMQFNGYVIYGSRDFSIPNGSLKLNGVSILSLDI